MTEPEWLRPLAIATLEQALADVLRPYKWKRVIAWCRDGGRLGLSDWKVAEILDVNPMALANAAIRLRESGVKKIPPVKDWLRKVFEEIK